MNNDKIRGAVLKHLREHTEPTTVSALVRQIRQENASLSQVPDFDFRSAVLRMMAAGDVESTAADRIVLAQHPLAARG